MQNTGDQSKTNVSALFEELRALQQEYLKHLEIRHLLISANVAALAAILGIVFAKAGQSLDNQTEDSSSIIIATVVLAYVSTFLGGLYLYSSDHMLKLIKRIRDGLRPTLILFTNNDNVLGWWVHAEPSFAPPRVLRKYPPLAVLYGVVVHPALPAFIIPAFFGLGFSFAGLSGWRSWALWIGGSVFTLAFIGQWATIQVRFVKIF